MGLLDSKTDTVSSVNTSVQPTTDASTAISSETPAYTQSATKTTNRSPVQAYAKLEGEDFCYYIRTLQVTLGRKVTKPDNVDIPLGNTKSVSRQHARLFYNFTTQRFEMMVFGKNGAFVNEQFIERGVTVPLENRTKIQIGEVSFVFLLPRMDVDESPQNENFGYISTPQQLEKQSGTVQRKEEQKESLPKDDRASGDDGNETPEPNPYGNKDVKPPYSYASLIAQAINSTSNKRMTLNGIYTYITTHYPYYQMAQNGWQNSIRHNLSLNKAFVKVPRGDAEPGKGAFWTIDSNAENQFTNGVYKRNKRALPKSTGSGVCSGTGIASGERKRVKREYSDSEEDIIKCGSQSKSSDDTAELSTRTSLNDTSETGTNSTYPKKPTSKTTTPTSASESKTSAGSSSNPLTTHPVSAAPASLPSPQNIQAQLQLQLQNTIRQHLLDPIRYPLPASIAQLLPQAIAQLPPQLASQLSATLQSALRAYGGNTTAQSPIQTTLQAQVQTTTKTDIPAPSASSSASPSTTFKQ